MASHRSNVLLNKHGLPYVVQKFGGTSVGKFLSIITEDIVKSYLESNRVVLVCSARSGETKSLGTTNRLLKAAEEAISPGSKRFNQIVDEICEDHISAARRHIHNPNVLADLERLLQDDCAKLKSFLEAAQIISEISPRSKDIIVGVGEKLSCRIVVAALQDKGVDAELVFLENVIDQKFNANCLGQDFYDFLARKFADAVQRCEDRIPVVTGYFGMVPGGILSNVGRGYTDLCAALIAVGLGAHELQVWKEVDGIFTADPNKVRTARLLSIITPEEASELTYYGSEVIHPFTMEQVIRANIPIRIKNVQNPGGKGTVIFSDVFSMSKYSSSPSLPRLLYENGYSSDLSRRRPTAVTIKNKIIVINVHSNRKTMSHGFFASIFASLDRFGIVVDLISTSEVHISMALGAEITENDLEKALVELRKYGAVDVLTDLAILSLVGKQMKNMVGIAGKMFTTLAKANVNIEMISQGASEINISCVIEESHATRALNAIHEDLLLAMRDEEELEPWLH